jgi:hypothetical protein
MESRLIAKAAGEIFDRTAEVPEYSAGSHEPCTVFGCGGKSFLSKKFSSERIRPYSLDG